MQSLLPLMSLCPPIYRVAEDPLQAPQMDELALRWICTGIIARHWINLCDIVLVRRRASILHQRESWWL
jgi:hypothetical protein